MSNSVARKIKREAGRRTIMQLSRDSLIVFEAGMARENTARALQLLEWATIQGDEGSAAYAKQVIAHHEWASSKYRTKRERKMK